MVNKGDADDITGTFYVVTVLMALELAIALYMQYHPRRYKAQTKGQDNMSTRKNEIAANVAAGNKIATAWLDEGTEAALKEALKHNPTATLKDKKAKRVALSAEITKTILENAPDAEARQMAEEFMADAQRTRERMDLLKADMEAASNHDLLKTADTSEAGLEAYEKYAIDGLKTVIDRIFEKDGMISVLASLAAIIETSDELAQVVGSQQDEEDPRFSAQRFAVAEFLRLQVCGTPDTI